MKKSTIVVMAILAVASVLILLPFMSYNGLVEKQENVKEKWGQVMNVYQRRADLIPNLVSTVKGAANFESETLTEIAEARAQLGQVKISENTFKDPEALEAYLKNQDRLSGALGRLMMQTENYPELRATQGFRDLQAQLEGTENRIAVERKRYNEAVKAYNTAVRKLPAALFAGLLGFEKVPYYEGEKNMNIERAPTVDFGKN